MSELAEAIDYQMTEDRCADCNHHEVQHRPDVCMWPVGSRHCGCPEFRDLWTDDLAARVRAAYDRVQRDYDDPNSHDIQLLADVALAAVSDHTFTVVSEEVEVIGVSIDEKGVGDE